MRTEQEIRDKLASHLERQDSFSDFSPIHAIIRELEWVLDDKITKPTGTCKRCGEAIYSKWLTYPLIGDVTEIPNDDGPICDKCSQSLPTTMIKEGK